MKNPGIMMRNVWYSYYFLSMKRLFLAKKKVRVDHGLVLCNLIKINNHKGENLRSQCFSFLRWSLKVSVSFLDYLEWYCYLLDAKQILLQDKIPSCFDACFAFLISSKISLKTSAKSRWNRLIINIKSTETLALLFYNASLFYLYQVTQCANRDPLAFFSRISLTLLFLIHNTCKLYIYVFHTRQSLQLNSELRQMNRAVRNLHGPSGFGATD